MLILIVMMLENGIDDKSGGGDEFAVDCSGNDNCACLHLKYLKCL